MEKEYIKVEGDPSLALAALPTTMHERLVHVVTPPAPIRPPLPSPAPPPAPAPSMVVAPPNAPKPAPAQTAGKAKPAAAAAICARVHQPAAQACTDARAEAATQRTLHL
ncbi:hypothetical protein EDB85DRAFT_2159495 [Lactarius pseudohatsudake]|nr:hypothetical protein EDB85DRAFT_2159495 [Lactarius pseudohatsudake]